MKALLFPGQGVQKIGMLNEIISSNPEIHDFVAEASEDLDFDLIKLITSGPEEQLNLTEYAQPAILATSIAIVKAKKVNSNISVTAGLSLGEYSALVYANCLRFSDALKLVNVRGKLMQSAVPEGTAGMLVVLNMGLEEIYKMIDSVNSSQEEINFSTDNAEGVSVLAGKNTSIEACKKYIEDNDFKRVKTQMVQMSVPSHCSLLSEAQTELEKLLNTMEFKNPEIPVIPNVLAQPTSNVDEIKNSLITQLTNTVRWRETLLFLSNNKIQEIIDAGPGKTIVNMARKLRSIEKTSLLDL
ncbi:MAG: malonyl CoA-acyl carrier protein transacylase [Proteobacteria bacterium]|nr:malonyl CoA-acyl carrier protein transacylase [Pseudomonadota bacterium]RZO98738.1 MAG: ACP S-malonyltransferase [Gammaproteobacteria bacterium]|tara:strand:+ start:88 stop:984 length:897 start_codon:yes stop_codon:yes gene_type:complete